jgi:leucyl/phenylalanyl-tRNA---protein transferase
MAEARGEAELLWFNPDPRAIIPLDGFHLSHSLRKAVRQQPYTLRVNTAFRDVMQACAAPRAGERESWINSDILAVYCELHEMGYAHSVECWHNDALVGGLYGVSLGGAFFGESMFSRQDNASKIAFVYLLEILLRSGHILLDTQFVNAHLQQFGVIEIPRTDYMARLTNALIALPNPSHQFSALAGTTVVSDPRAFTVMRPESLSRTTT